MIATHNVNVNGTWYKAGEVIPEAKPQKAEAPAVKPAEEAKPVAEEPKEVPKTRTAATRRKVASK